MQEEKELNEGMLLAIALIGGIVSTVFFLWAVGVYIWKLF